MNKRKRFIIQSALLSSGLLIIQSIDISWRYWVIAFLTVFAYFISAWSLKEAITKISWLTVLPLPALFTASVGLFYFLLPPGMLSRIIIITLFGIGIYALLLTENIFSVAAIRTIQLLRAAQAVGFLIALLTAFLLYDTIFSFKLSPWQNSLLVFLSSPLLVLSTIWSITLEEKLVQRLVYYALIISFLISQLAFFISLWPLEIITVSLFLVSYLYVILGVVQQSLSGRLFKKTLSEYTRVAAIIFIVTFLLANWS